MKYQQSFLGSKSEFADFIKKTIPELFSGNLKVDGKGVTIPTDKDLDYKIKLDDSEEGGAFSLKVSWDNEVNTMTEEDLGIDVD